MAAPLSLFFETLSKSLAGGLDLPLGFQIPPLRQEDVIQLNLSVMTQVKVTGSPRYAVKNLTGWNARAAVGTAGNVLAQANAFAIDATGTILTDSLNLNTAGVNALVGDAEVFLELIFTDPTGNSYGRKFPFRLEKAIYTAGAVVDLPSDTPLGRLEAMRLFMLKESAPGDGQILTSKSGLKRVFVYLDDDGTIQSPPLT